MTTATLLAINIPLCALFIAAWSGIPLWMVFKHPDHKPEGAKTLPAYKRVPAHPRVPAARPASAAAHHWHVDRLRLAADEP
jgi:hypothetical protein